MTRVFTEGFESGDVLFFDINYLGAASASIARSGTYSYYGNNAVMYGSKFVTGISEAYFRIGFYAASMAGRILAWYSDSGANEMGSLRVNASTRKLSLYTGSGTLVATGTHVLSLSTWYLLEVHVKIDNTTGVLEAKLDGISEASFSGDTQPSTATTFDKITYFMQDNNTYYDDLAMNNTSGGSDNSWCGDGRIVALLPNAAGDLSQLTNSAGTSVNNYTYVDERPSNGDTDYVEGAVVDNKDLYNLSAIGLTNIIVKRVWAEARARDTVASGGLISLVIKTNSAEYASSDFSLLTSYTAVKGPEYLINPNTATLWTISDLDALQVGPKTRS